MKNFSRECKSDPLTKPPFSSTFQTNMVERLKEGQLVGIVPRESEARLGIRKVDLANVRHIGDYLIIRPLGDRREYLYFGDKTGGIQYTIPELSSILEPQK